MDRLTAESAAQKSGIRAADVARLLALWDRVGGVDDAALSRWLAAAVPSHRVALTAQVQQFEAYVSAWLDANGVDVVPAPLVADDIIDGMRAGAPLDELLSRPVVEMRSRLAEGKNATVAFESARRRVESIAGTNHQQVYRMSAHRSWSDSPVTGYRRVLVGPENCLLCVQASTVRYYSDKLMPIHNGCDCSTAPFLGEVNRKGTIVEDLPTLETAKQAAQQATGRQYLDRDTLRSLSVDTDQFVAIAEGDHHELGPILKVAKHDTAPVPNTARREFNPDGTLKRGRGSARSRRTSESGAGSQPDALADLLAGLQADLDRQS